MPLLHHTYKLFQLAVKQCDRFSLTPNSDSIAYVNRYHNVVYFVDSEVKKVLDDLKSYDLLKNTIVICHYYSGSQ
ncbi:hypothetical protein [Coxiella-like endosymbiont]|uniref:hypothetical protein n=1 Tax=Coxiella-like endosymbiont TaxID=1592897 RepID=UPI00272AE73E|nr:hypothetical protein [Coxiella-like endosymbiont]